MNRSMKSADTPKQQLIPAPRHAGRRRSRPVLSRIWAFMAAISVVIGIVLAVAPGADAAAFTYGDYPPYRINATQVQGWANLSRDCSGTYGCFNSRA